MKDEPFCLGIKGRALCESCSGRYPSGEHPPAARIRHTPWPFDPCPHYRKAEDNSKPEVKGADK